MPLVRISLAFQHNSWAKNAGCLTEPILTLHVKLLKHFPMQNVRLVTCAFMIHHAAIKTLTCCSPAIYFPRVSSLFGRHILPYSSLSLSMTGAEPLSFKSSPPQFFLWRLENRTSSKMELPMDPNGNWGEQETYLEGLNKQNAKCSKEIGALTGGFDATAA